MLSENSFSDASLLSTTSSSTESDQLIHNRSAPFSYHTSKKPHISVDKFNEFHFKIPPEAPVFNPSAEDFKNPMNYINKIRPIAEKYGICKIRPPMAWQPPFTADVDKLVFIPRVQRLNELEAATRIKLNFLDQIAKFWELQGSSLKIPTVEKKALDLYSLHRLVQQEGGLDLTTKDRKWSKVACQLGYPQGKSIGTNLKSHYERILYPFDIYTSGKIVDLQILVTEPGSSEDSPHCILSKQSLPPLMVTPRSQRNTTFKERQLALLPSELISDSNTSKIKESYAIDRQDEHMILNDPMAKYICHTCNRGDAEESMLLCDGCDDSYHIFCLVPALQDIPKGDWRCPKCVVKEVSKPVEAFGFEQAQREYTLPQFGEMADLFKSNYFNMPVHLVPTDLVEKEFWRIVSSIDEDVTVEYGADLHTMEHGSGFPTKSSLHLLSQDQEYAESSWNLNNLPTLEESILGHINADINGMKIPWMYVGMCFATFCWHNEDHWSYSINYLHWGEPKTWYGVPGSKAEAFEETMKSAAPELFQSQPDLLHQLVTIMNPNTLMNAGLPVFRTDQNAGEFVITFPRAYHAGFNQGYNFAEAVNFAPADWMKMGRACINHYSKLRRSCVFSHDELVCKMALEPDRLNLGIATACYIDMAEMLDSEKKLRKNLLEWGVTNAEREAFELLPDDARQCNICKTTCFLSAVTCRCSTSLACLRHFSDLCECPPDFHTLKYRYTLDELPFMVQKLKVKAESLKSWLSKVRDILDPTVPRTITFTELQEIAQDAVYQKYPYSIILERLNHSVLEAQKCVAVIQQLDVKKIHTRTRNNLEYGKYKLSLEELDMFVLEIDNLCCLVQEGTSVKELQKSAKNWTKQADGILKRSFIETDLTMVYKLVQEGYNFCLDLPHLVPLNDRILQYEWYQTVRQLRQNYSESLTLIRIRKSIHEGMKLLPHAIIEKELTELNTIMLQIEDWEISARQCFDTGAQQKISIIENVLERANIIKGVLPSYQILTDALKKSKDWLESVEFIQQKENYPYFHTLEDIVEQAKDIPFPLDKLQKVYENLQAARNWKKNACRTFLKQKLSLNLIDTLSPRVTVIGDKRENLETIYIGTKFTEEMDPIEMVNQFKNAEVKEMQSMSQLRKINLSKNSEIDRYCVCKRGFFGIMYNCQLCKNWYHTTCVPAPKQIMFSQADDNTGEIMLKNKISPVNKNLQMLMIPSPIHRQIDEETKYLCPLCIRSRRPRLEVILQLLITLQQIPIRLPEGEALQCLTERAMHWQDRARQALALDDVKSELIKLSKKLFHLQCKNIKQTKQHLNFSNKTKVRSSLKGDISQDLTDSSDDENVKIMFKNAPSISGKKEAFLPPIGIDLFNITNKIGGISGAEACIENPLIALKETTLQYLEYLMMEGDLLEVSMDETQYLWHVLNAAKPSITKSCYAQVFQKYKIFGPMSNYESRNNLKKRKPDSKLLSNTKTAHGSLNDTITTNYNFTKLRKSDTETFNKFQECDVASLNIKRENYYRTENILTPQNKQSKESDNCCTLENQPNSAGKLRARKPKDVKMVVKEENSNLSYMGRKSGQLLLPFLSDSKIQTGSLRVLSPPLNSNTNTKSLQKHTDENVVAIAILKSNNSFITSKMEKVLEVTQSDDEDECSDINCERPIGNQVDWVQCDGGCNKWFHMLCVGLKKNEINPDDDYICKLCRKNGRNLQSRTT